MKYPHAFCTISIWKYSAYLRSKWSPDEFRNSVQEWYLQHRMIYYESQLAAKINYSSPLKRGRFALTLQVRGETLLVTFHQIEPLPSANRVLVFVNAKDALTFEHYQPLKKANVHPPIMNKFVYDLPLMSLDCMLESNPIANILIQFSRHSANKIIKN